MRKVLIAALFLLPGTAVAGNYGDVPPGSGIMGTAHDLRFGQEAGNLYGAHDVDNAYGQAGGDLNRICVWCHAPHHTLKPAELTGDIDYLPLWNHRVTTQSFQMYNNGADEPSDQSHQAMSEILANQPGPVSKLCLSCHDGSVAVNEYGFAPGDITSSGVRKGDVPVLMNEDYVIGWGGDLSNHHPIGFDYQAVAVTDDEIADIDTVIGNYQIGDLLWAGQMECTTCHDVHNSKNTGKKLLWVSDKESAFCLTCHLK